MSINSRLMMKTRALVRVSVVLARGALVLTWRPYTAAIMTIEIKGKAPEPVATMMTRYTSYRNRSIGRNPLDL